MLPIVKIAACHVSPIFLNAEKTTERALRLIDEAASNGAHLIAFPESYIPGFPIWAGTGASVDNSGLFARFVEASIYADGPEIAQIQSRCAERKVVVSLGFSERSRHSVGCLWNSNIVIGENGKVLAHHRKMCPTYWEKLIWSNGYGYGLQVCHTASAGKVGTLICGKNTNLLARHAMMAQGEQVHVACFPPAWPTKRRGRYQNRTADAVRSAAHSFEAKCFTVVSAAVLDEETKKFTVDHDPAATEELDYGTHSPHSSVHYLRR